MKSHKRLFILFFLLSGALYGQTVIVQKDVQRIKGENAYGFSTKLEASKEEVAVSLSRFLKTFGKPKQQDELITVAETTLNGKNYAKPLYGYCKGTSSSSTAWIGINLNEWGSDSTVIVSQLQGWVKSFGVNFLRDKIQGQINEAQKAVEAVEKQQQRNTNENKNISQRIVNNKNEKIQLLKALENNKTDSVNLQLRLVKNSMGKDSLIMVLEKVKKEVEFHKERQRKVN